MYFRDLCQVIAIPAAWRRPSQVFSYHWRLWSWGMTTVKLLKRQPSSSSVIVIKVMIKNQENMYEKIFLLPGRPINYPVLAQDGWYVDRWFYFHAYFFLATHSIWPEFNIIILLRSHAWKRKFRNFSHGYDNWLTCYYLASGSGPITRHIMRVCISQPGNVCDQCLIYVVA